MALSDMEKLAYGLAVDAAEVREFLASVASEGITPEMREHMQNNVRQVEEKALPIILRRPSER